jgi:hypothetical protein
MKKTLLVAFAAILATTIAISPARATVLAPGGSVTAPDASFGPVVYPSTYTVVASSVNQVGTPGGGSSITATLTTEVLRETGGTLDFLYQVENTTAAGGDDLHRVTTIHFKGWTTDVQFATTSPGYSFVAPGTTMMTSADRSANGATIGWQISPEGSAAGVEPGKWSNILIIKTNATSFTTGSTFAIDGGNVSFNSFQPGPEPSSMAIAGLGALGLIGYGIRRRRMGA